jgi:hypothetical protein
MEDIEGSVLQEGGSKRISPPGEPVLSEAEGGIEIIAQRFRAGGRQQKRNQSRRNDRGSLAPTHR